MEHAINLLIVFENFLKWLFHLFIFILKGKYLIIFRENPL